MADRAASYRTCLNGLIEAASALHRSVLGHGTGLPEEAEADIVRFLKERLAGWHPVEGLQNRYDEAVRELVRAALAEHATMLARRKDLIPNRYLREDL